MQTIASGSEFSKDEASFLIAGGQLTFNTTRTRAILLNVVSFDDLRSREPENEQGDPNLEKKRAKLFMIEKLTKAYESRGEDMKGWNLYKFCSEEIHQGCNGAPNFKGTKAQFDPSWPLKEEYAQTQLLLFKPYWGKKLNVDLKKSFDENGKVKEFQTYREALEDFMFDKKFPRLVLSKIIRAKMKFKFDDDAGHEFNATKEYLSPSEDGDVPANSNAILAAENDDEVDVEEDFDPNIDEIDISRLNLPNPADIDWSIGYDSKAEDWLTQQCKKFYRKRDENISEEFVPLNPKKYQPEKARGFAQHFLIAFTIMAKFDRMLQNNDTEYNVIIQGNPGLGKTWIQSTQLNIIRSWRTGFCSFDRPDWVCRKSFEWINSPSLCKNPSRQGHQQAPKRSEPKKHRYNQCYDGKNEADLPSNTR